ncbi:xylulose kinase [Chloroflexi bacterium TSY]|nr:xylulose kinase [Chloroflexi bacterium TSY]
MTSDLIISIDSSTTAVKAIAWNPKGVAVAEGVATYPMIQPAPGFYEQNAEDWWDSACRAIRDCVRQVDINQIVALGITHQRETFVPVDGDGRPIRNGILWLDERNRHQVTWLEETFGRDELHRLIGKPPSVNLSLPKIVWLLQHEPELLKQAHQFLDVHAFLVYRLTGHFRTSVACADPMGLIDMPNQCWATELIEGIGLSVDQFPELVAPGAVIGYITDEASVATGLPISLPVVAGAGDGQCAGLGANAIGQGRAYLNMGTAVVSGALSHEYFADRAFRTLYAPLPNAFFLEHVLKGGVFTVGWYVEKFAPELRNSWLPLSAEEMLGAAAAKVPPGCEGLMLVPYWNDVLNPYWDPLASGMTVGWRGHHGREHFYRAILEGVAFEQRLVGDAMMETIGQRFTEYVTMGGGSRSALWCQIRPIQKIKYTREGVKLALQKEQK